jgi:hypothetical protein
MYVGVEPGAGVVTVGLGTVVPRATIESNGRAVGFVDANETEKEG